eukprot:355066-Chlamydomonas_euryale.AAC.8
MQRSTRWERAVAALIPVISSTLAGWGWSAFAQDRAKWHSFCDSGLGAASALLRSSQAYPSWVRSL